MAGLGRINRSSLLILTNQRVDTVLVKGTLLLTSTLTVMAAATIAPALPSMEQQFEAVPNADFLVRLVLTLPALLIALTAPLAGVIVDRFGRKRLLIMGTALYAVAGTSGFIAPTLGLVLLSRVFLGLAVAGIMTSVTTLITDYYADAQRAHLLGLQAGFIGFGAVVFLTLGGFLADVSWRHPFLIYGMALPLLPFVVMALREPDSGSASPQPSDSLPVDTTPWGLLGMLYLMMLITQITFYMIPVQLPFHLVDLVDASASQSGIAIAALSLTYALTSMSYGWLDARLGHMGLVVAGFGLIAIGFGVIAFAAGWVMIYIGLIISALGLGMLVPNFNVWLASEVPAAIRGRALGGLTTALFLGQFLSPLVSQPIANATSVGLSYAVVGAAVALLTPLFVLGSHWLLQQPVTEAA